jgi:hypothetical protein
MRRNLSLLLKSNDFYESKLNGLIKFILSCVFGLNFSEVSLGNGAKNNRVLLVSSFQYRKKRALFDRLSIHLEARLVIFGFGWKTDLPITALEGNELVICSAANFHYRLLIDIFSQANLQYCVVQHGAFDFAHQKIGLQSELQAADGKKYYFWDKGDRDKFRRLMPNSNLIDIEFKAHENDKTVLPGVGFATRGREFFKSDLKYLLSNEQFERVQRVHFHPSYGLFMIIGFILAVLAQAKFTRVAPAGSISKALITRSKSMHEASKLSEASD